MAHTSPRPAKAAPPVTPEAVRDPPSRGAAQPDLAGQLVGRLATLPRYYTTRDLLDALGGWDPTLDAYCAGLLPPQAIEALEGHESRLSLQLLRRLLAVALAVHATLGLLVPTAPETPPR